LFFLGKLDLNYVWLQLGPLRRKTGWDEYWEARRSLDAVLKANPRHVRARVARAWIDYIVDTRRDLARAIDVARRLAHDFPDNPELAAFLDARLAESRR